MGWNALLLALREMRRNVMRSFLTILGVVIGVAAVIVMVTVGAGATAQVTQQIASLGTNLLMVTPGKRMMGPGSSGAGPFRIEDAESIRRGVTAIAAVAPVSSRSSTAIFGNANWTTVVTGVDEGYFAARNWGVRSGRVFTAGELRSGAAMCIIGATVHSKLFGRQDALNGKIRLTKLSCTVIGVLEAKGQSMMGSDQDDIVLIPLRAFQRRVAGNQDVGMIQVSMRQGASVDKVTREIEQVMRTRRHLSAAEENDFSVMDMKQISSMFTSTTQVLTALLSAVAAVSLLVGGIGIMNIMLVSVTERTREIGIRLAIGALEREVLLQFLVEAMVLSSFGGLIGIVLALAASLALTQWLHVPLVLNGGVMALAFAFSALIGVAFGYLPARKAARMDPIEALRHE